MNQQRRIATWAAVIALLPFLIPATIILAGLMYSARGLTWLVWFGIDEIIVPDLKKAWQWLTSR